MCHFVSTKLYAYNAESKPPQNLGAYPSSAYGERLMPGSSNTYTWTVGTTTLTGTGSAGFMGTNTIGADAYGGLRWNGTLGIWQIKGINTATWHQIGTASVSYLDSTFVKQDAGTGSNNVFTTPTIAGGTQSGNTELTGNYVIGTETVAKQKIQWLSDATGYVQAQINAKQDSLGGNVVTTVSNDVGTGTGAIRLKGTGDISVLKVGTNEFNINMTGTPTAKADIKEGGTTTVTGATNIDFDETYFDVTADGGGADIDFVENAVGTSTAGASKIVRSGTDGKIKQEWFISGYPVKMSATGTNTLSSLGTIPDDSTIPEITEGTQVLSMAYSASDENNWLIIEAVINVSIGGSGSAAGIGAVFKTGVTDAIAANRMMTGADASNNKDLIIPITSIPFLAGTTTAQTYTLRGGSPAGTARCNAAALDGLGRLGGKMYTILKITEYTP